MGKAGPKWRVLFALLCCVFLALAPALAEARAGSSYGGRPSSFGSRGARSWDYNGAQPLNRGYAQPSPGQTGPASGMAPSAYRGSFVQRHPFLTGMAGGLLGSWLFGHSAYAEGGGGAGSFLGTLLWLVAIGLLVWFAMRLFRSRAVSGGGPARASPFMARSAGAAASPRAGFRGRDVNFSDADLQAFQRLHAAVQEAWSAGDLAALRRLMTPQMLDYFSHELSRNAARGVRNQVSNVQLVSGELAEAWEEGDLQYATAVLRWRAVDYVLRLGATPGDRAAVVSGDPRTPLQVEEVWTFVRRRGGDWLLSAIQQV